MASLTIVAENRVALSKDLVAEHGFSAWIDTPNGSVLWDCGQGYALPQNAPRLMLDWKRLTAITLSHGHFDHTGGLATALDLAGGAKVMLHPACFTPKLARREFFGKTIQVPIGIPLPRADYVARGASFEETESVSEIIPGVFFVPSIPMKTDFEKIEPGFLIGDGSEPDSFADDAALAVKTDKGVSVILGCAHRGMINTLRHVAEVVGGPIRQVWGGTHLVEKDPEQVMATVAALKELGVDTVAAAHCTGFDRELVLARELGESFRFAHVGARAEL